MKVLRDWLVAIPGLVFVLGFVAFIAWGFSQNAADAGDAGPPRPKVDATLARIDNQVVLTFPSGYTTECAVVYDVPGPRGKATGIWCR